MQSLELYCDPLFIVAVRGVVEVVKLLLAAGSDPNRARTEAGPYGSTLMEWGGGNTARRRRLQRARRYGRAAASGWRRDEPGQPW